MKKTSKILLTSILTIVACISLIAGATFALFTSESKTNIAITAAKVNVKASIDESSLGYSYDEIELEGANENIDYQVVDGNLQISKMAPGDTVKFDVDLDNTSDIAIKWQLSVSAVDETQAGFFQLLNVETTGYSMISTSKASLTEWQLVTEPGGEIAPLHVSVTMPSAVTSAQVAAYSPDQTLEVRVTAIQGNAKTTNPQPDVINLHESFDVTELETMLESATEPQKINLLNDIELDESVSWEALELMAGSEFKGNGHTISFKEGDPTQLVATAESTTISDVTLRLSTDFGKRCTWDEAGETEVAWQANNANGLQIFANEVNGGTAHAVPTLHAPRVRRAATVIAHTSSTFEGELVELTQNIDLSGQEWTPIGEKGSDATKLFKGTFDGKGYTIANLTYTTDQSGAGLFNATGAKFQNIKLNNITISGTEYVGALVGYGYTSNYENVTATNITLNGNHFVGGIAGGSYSDFVNCHVEHLVITCTPDGEPDHYDNGDKVGGLIGIQENGNFTMENCSVTDATLTAFRDVGGFVGYSNTGHVTASKVEDVHIIIDRTKDYKDSDTGLDKPFNADSYIGRPNGDCSIDETSRNAVKNFTVEYKNCPGFIMDTDNNGYVFNKEGLETFRDKVNSGSSFSGKNIYLMTNIDLEGDEWKPIGYYGSSVMNVRNTFSGNFDGNGYTISNFTITDTPQTSSNYFTAVNYYYGGLFGRISNSTVQNVNVENVTVNGYMYLGGVVDEAYNSTIKNCDVNNVTINVNRKVDGTNGYKGSGYGYTNLSDIHAGAIAGYTYTSDSVRDCSANATINITTKTGELKNVQCDANDKIIGFEVGSVEDYIAAAGMINAEEFDLGALKAKRATPITVNFDEGDYDFLNKEYEPWNIRGYIFDGNGAVIKNLSKRNSNGYAGFFGSIEDCEVKNFVFENANLSGCDVGVVAGKAINSDLDNITVRGNVNLTWLAKQGMNYSTESGIGILTGYWKNTNTDFKFAGTLECTANISFGKIANAIPGSMGSEGAMWSTDEDTYYFGTQYNRFTYVPDGTNIVVGQGYSLNTTGDPEQVSGLNIGDKITLGSYPQTKVTEEEILTQLEEYEQESEWTLDEEAAMKYTDVTLASGEKYRGVFLTSEKEISNGYEAETYYWFHYEPITWRVVAVPQSRFYGQMYTLFADCVLDSRVRFTVEEVRPETGEELLVWLSDTFYNTAFDASQKTLLDTYDSVKGSPLNVTLLKEADWKTFQTEVGWTVENRLSGSDYAFCQGLWNSNGAPAWWLRYDAQQYSAAVRGTSLDPIVTPHSAYVNQSYGVVPVIYMDYTIDALTLD